MYIKNFIFVILMILLSVNLYSIEKYVSVDLLRKESSPRFVENGLLITLSKKQAAKVFLRTNIDGWKKDYYFKESLYGILYTIIPYNEKYNKILYKLNFNGYWEKDPNNNNFIEDNYGTEVSYVNMPEDYIYSQKSPKIEQSDGKLKKVIFYYFNPDASDVNFVSFLDKWNQFSHQMYKNQDGYWEFTMDCKKGYYYYYFLADDKKVIDIENPNKVYDDIAGEVSVFIIE
jgi:hypothetical protein